MSETTVPDPVKKSLLEGRERCLGALFKTEPGDFSSIGGKCIEGDVFCQGTGNRFDARALALFESGKTQIKELAELQILKYEADGNGVARVRQEWKDAPYELVLLFRQSPEFDFHKVAPIGFEGDIKWVNVKSP